MKNFAVFRGICKISQFFAVTSKFRDSAHTAINFCLCSGQTKFTPGATKFTPGETKFTPGETNFTPGETKFTPGETNYTPERLSSPPERLSSPPERLSSPPETILTNSWNEDGAGCVEDCRSVAHETRQKSDARCGQQSVGGPLSQSCQYHRYDEHAGQVPGHVNCTAGTENQENCVQCTVQEIARVINVLSKVCTVKYNLMGLKEKFTSGKVYCRGQQRRKVCICICNYSNINYRFRKIMKWM